MSSLTNYRGLQVFPSDAPPPGGGGLAISNNFTYLVDWHPLSKWTQTGNPTAGNDSTANYFPGSLWLNSSTNELFLCMSSAPGAAVWQQVILAPINQGTGNAINPNTNSMVVGSNCIAGYGFSQIKSISSDTVTLYSPGFAATPTVGDNLLYTDQNGHVINTKVVTATSATSFTVTAGSLTGMTGGYVCDASLSTEQSPAVAIGSGAMATGPYAIAVGDMAAATGGNAVSFGGDASGFYSLAMGLGSSASAPGALAFGNSPLATGSYSTAIGFMGTATGGSSVAVGSSCSAGGYGSVATGQDSSAYGDYSVAMGSQANSPLYGQNSFSSGAFANAGDAQTSTFIVRNTTTNTTPTNLYLDGSLVGIVLPANQTAWRFTADVAAYDSTTNLSGSWEIKGCVKLNNSGTYSLVGTPATTSWLDSAFTGSATVTASSGFQVQVTGISTDTIRWVAKVTVVQVSFGTP